jgi:hypothetical protein
MRRYLEEIDSVRAFTSQLKKTPFSTMEKGARRHMSFVREPSLMCSGKRRILRAAEFVLRVIADL